MVEKYKHVTLFEVGNGAGEWFTLFSDSQPCCDLVNHDAIDRWPGYEQALTFAMKWIKPKDSTLFVSHLHKGRWDDRRAYWLKNAGETIEQAIARHLNQGGRDAVSAR